MTVRAYVKRAYHLAISLANQRSRYRLFLKSTFGTLTSKAANLATASDHFSTDVQPIVVHPPFGKSMLVLAPHQDDEAIGCGGAMALQAQSGAALTVVILQDGGGEHATVNLSRQELVRKRNEESSRAAEVIGAGPPVFLNYRSLRESHSEAAEALRNLIVEKKVDAVFAPFVLDNHPDHRRSNLILAEALQDIPWRVRVFGYEVWGLVIPNVIVVIDEVMDAKRAMLACFEYANSAVDYLHSTEGLNMYRSRLLVPGTGRYAECYFEADRDEFIFLARSISNNVAAPLH